MRPSAVLAIFGLVLVASCSSAPSGSTAGDFPSQALTKVTSDGGTLAVEVRTAPSQPPTRGTLRVQLAVSDATSGAPVDGLDVAMVPWMPAMGHGSSIAPTVTAAGGGRYVVDDVSLFMPGRWELRTTLRGTATDDVATAAIDVQ
jgi:hypothetical protein